MYTVITRADVHEKDWVAARAGVCLSRLEFDRKCTLRGGFWNKLGTHNVLPVVDLVWSELVCFADLLREMLFCMFIGGSQLLWLPLL